MARIFICYRREEQLGSRGVAFTIDLGTGSVMTCSWTSMRSVQGSITPG